MCAEERKKLRKQRKREKRFVKRTVILNGMVAFVLCMLIAAALVFGPSYLKSEIDFALSKRNFGHALEIADFLGKEVYQETGKRIEYILAEDVLNEGRYDEAAEMFRALGNYSDAQDRARECAYRKADSVFASGDYEKAAQLFLETGGYKDSLERSNRCKYLLAESCVENGDFSDALKRFEALGDYSDAKARRIEIAMNVTGLTDPQAALDAASGLTPEEIEHLGKLNEARETLKNGWVDVGFKHTVARDMSGKAYAAGDNQYGQTDVGEWSDIAFIASGAYHTVGLKSDGTVVACGRNDCGQTNVSGWENVASIAAGAYDTYALTKDGKILHVGFNAGRDYSGYTGITGICAGSYALGALYGNGTMIASSAACAVSGESGLFQADVNTGYGIAIMRNGKTYATFGDTGWENVVTVSAGGAGALGIDYEGRVLSYWFRKTDFYDFSDVAAVAVAAGGGHHAVLTNDGRVIVFGDNESGQANTQDWKLF